MSRLTYITGMAKDEVPSAQGSKPAHIEDRCEHPGCNKAGTLGFQSMKDAPRRTWCHEHYPHWTAEELKRQGRLPA